MPNSSSHSQQQALASGRDTLTVDDYLRSIRDDLERRTDKEARDFDVSRSSSLYLGRDPAETRRLRRTLNKFMKRFAKNIRSAADVETSTGEVITRVGDSDILHYDVSNNSVASVAKICPSRLFGTSSAYAREAGPLCDEGATGSCVSYVLPLGFALGLVERARRLQYYHSVTQRGQQGLDCSASFSHPRLFVYLSEESADTLDTVCSRVLEVVGLNQPGPGCHNPFERLNYHPRSKQTCPACNDPTERTRTHFRS